MTESSSVFFEGTEKKIELLVDSVGPSLRGLGDRYWRRVAEACGAQVLSKMSSDDGDAYLLSESSLFVFDDRLLMITCGRTRLVDAMSVLAEEIPVERVTGLIYERKNEVFPHVQPTSFFDDARALNETFPGRAFKFGDEDDHHLYLYHLDRAVPGADTDTTVEVLMYGLDADVAGLFRGASRPATEVRRGAALEELFDGYTVDDHLFQPAGYSLNGLAGDRYRTLHVTPDTLHSYASFETNDAGDAPEELVRRVVAAFRPRAFDLVLFHAADGLEPGFEGYRRKGHVMEDLSCGYRVRFMNYYLPQPGVSRPVELPIS